MAGRGNAGLLLSAQDVYDFSYKRRLHQRLVALQVDDDVVVSEAQLPRGLRDAIGAGGVLGARHQRRVAVRAHRVRDAGVVRGDVHRGCAALGGALAYPHDHRPAAEVDEGLSREAGRRVARGNNDAELHVTSSSGGSLRASSSSITGMPSFTGYARRSALQTSSRTSLR